MCTTGVYSQVQPFKELKQHMPHPRRGMNSHDAIYLTISIGTVIEGDNICKAVDTFTNTREYKCDNTGNCTMPIGEVSDFIGSNE